jgi:outer membrane protein
MDNAGTNTKPRILIASALILLAAIFALSAGTASSQEKPIPEIASPVLTSVPLSPIDQAEKDGTASHLSLKDVTKMALQNNLDIAISDTNEDVSKYKILQDHGAYDPSLTITLGARSTTQPNTNLASASSTGLSNNTKLDTYNVQFNQNIPTGASIVANLNGNRSDTNQSFALFTPQYNSTSSIQLTQPLLRNRATDQSRSTIKIANLDLKISDSQFRQTITSTIGSIQGSYWDLVSAIRDYAIKRDSVKLAQITVDQNREKVRIGTLSQIDITVAQAALASQVVNLIASVQNINVAENNLRSTISNDRKSEIWQMVIVPKDSADFVAYKMDLENALDAALKNRPELEQYDLQMKETAINYNLDKNLTKWQVDAVGSFGTVGVAGPQSLSALTGQPTIPSSMVGGFGTAYQSLFTQGFKNWFVGFNLGIPLRNRTVEGQLGQLQVQKKQLSLNRKSQEQKITVQIRNDVSNLNNNQQTVEAAKVARQLAEIQLDGETKRFQAGTSQPFLLLQRQNDLLTAQETELQALVAYKKAVITLQQDMFTLLESNDFEIAGAKSGKGLK